jgi:hypothetical protein
MTPSATNSAAAEFLINHASAETLNTGQMTPSATNSTAIRTSAAVLLVAEGVMRPVFSVSALTWFIRTSAAVLLIAEGVIRLVFSHVSGETLNTGE